MINIATLLQSDNTTIAVVGANNNPHKYGYVIYKDLKRKGYRVYPVNPKAQQVDGDPCYATLEDLPEKPTIVNIVTPPQATLTVLKECQRLGIMNVWIQPGAEDPDVMIFVQENGFNYLANACIMVESRMSAPSI